MQQKKFSNAELDEFLKPAYIRIVMRKVKRGELAYLVATCGRRGNNFIMFNYFQIEAQLEKMSIEMLHALAK